MSKYFPLFVDLSDRKIIVIGGGEIASRRITTLLQFTENFTVIAKSFTDDILKKRDVLRLVEKNFELGDIENLRTNDMVFAITDDHVLNEGISLYCKSKNILVNVSTDKNLCSFYFPAVYTENEMVVGITASGKNHKKVKELRERIEAMEKKVIIGSRESRLAVIQSEMVLDYLKENNISCELLTMKTTGDIILDKTLDKIGGKGLFTKELDRALIEKRSHLSVHSLKDMPMEVAEELPVLGFSKREDPRDVLILPQGVRELDFSKPIGCSSFRRVLQLKRLFPQAQFKSIRGNVITRLQKLDSGEYGALVLASAGVKRLGLHERISRYFTTEEVLPACGQGIVAVQGRQGEDYSYLSGFFDENSYYMAVAERGFVRTLNGGCSSPIACYSEINQGEITITGLYYDEKTQEYFKETVMGDMENGEEIAIDLAIKMKNKV